MRPLARLWYLRRTCADEVYSAGLTGGLIERHARDRHGREQDDPPPPLQGADCAQSRRVALPTKPVHFTYPFLPDPTPGLTSAPVLYPASHDITPLGDADEGPILGEAVYRPTRGLRYGLGRALTRPRRQAGPDDRVRDVADQPLGPARRPGSRPTADAHPCRAHVGNRGRHSRPCARVPAATSSMPGVARALPSRPSSEAAVTWTIVPPRTSGASSDGVCLHHCVPFGMGEHRCETRDP